MFKLLVSLALYESSLAMAEGAPAAPQGAMGGITPLIPMILIFAVFYFLIIRPQQKKTKDHQQFITQLKRGEVVVTSSGIIGTIRTVTDRFVTLEIDEGVTIKVLRSSISESATSLKEEAKPKVGLLQTQTQAPGDKK